MAQRPLPRQARSATLLLFVLAASTARAGPPPELTTGEAPPEAAPAATEPLDAATEPEPEPPTPSPPKPALDEAALLARKADLEHELTDLQHLLAGTLPETISLAELLGLDLADDDALRARAAILETEIAARRRPAPAPSESAPTPPPAPPPTPSEPSPEPAPERPQTPDARPPEAPPASPPASPATPPEAPPARPPEANTSPVDTPPVDTSPAWSAPAAEPPPPRASSLAAEVAALELRVLETRLAVLALPLGERQALVNADAERLRFARATIEAVAAARDAAVEARAAEAARQAALDAAIAARSALQRRLAEERAAAEAVRRDQAQLRGRLAEERHAFELRRRDRDWPGIDLLDRVDAVAPGSDEAAELYDALVDALEITRTELRAALRSAEADPDVPRYRPDLASLPSTHDGHAEEEAELRRRAREIDLAADDLAALRRTLALDLLDAVFDHESRLYAARIDLLDRLPDDKRRAVLGLGHEGIAQLGREVDRFILATRWYRVQRESAPRRLLVALADPYTLARVAGGAAWLCALVLLALLGVRRGHRWLRALQSGVVRHVRSATLARALRGLVATVDGLLGELVLLAAVLLAWPALGDAREIGEIELLHTVLVDYALYRLFLQITHRGIAAVRQRRLDEATSARLLRSLHLIGRTALTIVIFLSASERVIGRGYLYRLVFGFAWLGALPIAAVLIRWWRDAIADAYLVYRGDGALAEAVRRTRGRWFGFFVATAAVLILLVVGVARFVRGFILGFEQSRKALAFVFRRRLERRAEAMEDEVPAGRLAADLSRALTLNPVADPDLVIPHFPDLDLVLESVTAWREAPTVGATLVVGDPGVGKTTWLLAVTRRIAALGLPVTTIRPPGRLLDPAALLGFLADALAAPPAARQSLDALRAWLLAGPARVIAIDDLQRLHLRGVDTSGAWDALDDLIATTGRRVHWVCAIARLPYEYLRWANRGDGSFRAVIHLDPWPEDQIAALLRARTGAAGYTVRYDDLVVDRLEGAEAHAQIVGTEREYARLLWDYADGSPAVALECWRSSLIPAGPHAVRVRLFRRPDEALLEHLHPPQRFILASVLWHQSLTCEEAARSLRYPSDLCHESLELLAEWGALEVDAGRYRGAVAWLPAIHRFLRRNHLIEAS